MMIAEKRPLVFRFFHVIAVVVVLTILMLLYAFYPSSEKMKVEELKQRVVAHAPLDVNVNEVKVGDQPVNPLIVRDAFLDAAEAYPRDEVFVEAVAPTVDTTIKKPRNPFVEQQA